MRENALSAGIGRATPRGPQVYEGTIIPERIDSMWALRVFSDWGL